MKKGKVLVVTTVASTIDQFCMNDIDTLLKIYDEVHVLANFKEGNNTSQDRIEEFKQELINKKIIIHDINLSRFPFNKNNFLKYKEIKQLIRIEKYDLIHCHTPIASIITRIAAKKFRKTGTKVIYTAHGFHFFKGAPLLNWILYYPLEKICAYFTDVIITINKEDYELAKRKMKAKKIEYVPGVGVDTNKFAKAVIDKNEKRKELGLTGDNIVLLSVGELNKNKNHEVIIRALAKLNNPNIHYIIAGRGNLELYLNELSKELNIENRVHLLGFRKDIQELYNITDIFCFPSYREGLSVAMMEAMGSKLPIICSNIRGNIDLVKGNKGGILCNPSSVDEFLRSIEFIINNKEICKSMGEYNRKIISSFDIKTIKDHMKTIYEVI